MSSDSKLAVLLSVVLPPVGDMGRLYGGWEDVELGFTVSGGDCICIWLASGGWKNPGYEFTGADGKPAFEGWFWVWFGGCPCGGGGG